MDSTSARVSSSMPSSPNAMGCDALGGLRRHSLDQQHFFGLVGLLKFYFDDFVVGGLHGAADETGFDRQLAVAAIDQHQQLHPRRAAMIEQRIERGPDSAAGVQHVIHEDDVFPLHGERDLGRVH